MLGSSIKRGLLIFIVLSFPVCTHAESQASENCRAIVKSVLERISSADHCAKDIDCILTDFGCPFGCGGAFNVSEIPAIQAMVDDYVTAGCENCAYRCPHLKKVPKAGCKNGKCIDVENTG